jgi:hypothetical protein
MSDIVRVRRLLLIKAKAAVGVSSSLALPRSVVETDVLVTISAMLRLLHVNWFSIEDYFRCALV